MSKDNQQPSIFRNVWFLAMNAKFGDGYLWTHPQGKEAKAIWSSTTPELLEAKQALVPQLFGTGVTKVNTRSGVYPNAKPLFQLASLTHPVFTEVRNMSKEDLFDRLDLEHFGLWYLDDGCCVRRNDSNSVRISLSVGDCCSTREKQRRFESMLKKNFGEKYGNIKLNNSRATANNKTWYIPLPVARVILEEASKYNVLPHKFP